MKLYIPFGLPILFLLLALQPTLFAQETAPLPTVFIIGEYEQQFEELLMDYPANLLQVCKGDMAEAFERWIVMSGEIEAYAEKMNFDILGVNAWFHVFFDQTGKIDHLAYYLKPDSKNVDLKGMTRFLEEFIAQYQFPLIAEKNYQHYTSVQFPLIYKK